jgi:DNA polymerase I
MIRLGTRTFSRVTLVDYEFSAPPGGRPRPICLVARDFETGQTTRVWEDELQQHHVAPYPTGPDALVVAYYASAEISCHLALGWPVPTFVLDLFVEFRNATNGVPTIAGNTLLGALAHYGIDAIAAITKEEMRQLALRGGPWSNDERGALLDYCESDVLALDKLLRRMLPHLDGNRSLLRGRFMVAAARMEHLGVPVDVATLMALRAGWEPMKMRLVARIDAGYGVYEGTTFKRDQFARLLATHGIPWPRLASGALALDEDSFRQMTIRYPVLRPLHELRVSLSQLRLHDLAVGQDGRNRTLLSAFRARSGRNAPSNTQSIFGPAVWLRKLIRPERDTGLAYVDYEQQEFGIAAALSGDPAMLAAYASGDPYLAFAKQAGAIPATGTRETHGAIRELFKTCALGVQYGMGAETLAARIGRSRGDAHHLLQLHRRTYPRFWRWSDGAVDFALLHNSISTVFGWTLRVGPDVNPRSLRNFPMQANGAEMLRVACCRATEAGLQICAPVHDAVLIEAPLDGLDGAVTRAQRVLADASEVVLDGFRLRTDVKVYRHPDRFDDPRGTAMWEAVQAVLAELGSDKMRHLESVPEASWDTGVQPDGTLLSYGWDTSGHPSSLISPSGS